jgi:hypothetical protein
MPKTSAQQPPQSPRAVGLRPTVTALTWSNALTPPPVSSPARR